ncbi:nucleolar preribosomal assembly protein, putative [Plasmodium gallinaceum]|uniref:Nucleolar preribosomal assembly protein, putative n=1 Tax=Plasmodium gallinaceum TaxID=5849 RepID=A0A1J1GXT9_PLAGA|nr:nucleolar preribosomal assembly protein, putative [Plasmodium gallinaceum]CRG97296.1 nucleolar preribosomal assembly protein, putative [Plasmodium gallinaceum]
MRDMKFPLNVESYKKKNNKKVENFNNNETSNDIEIKRKNMKKEKNNNYIARKNFVKKIIKKDVKSVLSTLNLTEKKKIKKKKNKKHNSNMGFNLKNEYIKNKIENKPNGDIKDDEIYKESDDKLGDFNQNKVLLVKKLQEIELKSNNPNEWLEKLDITSSEHFYMKNINLFGNCEKREEEFLQIAHKNLIEALKKLQDLNISFNRPYDFLADMIKSDIHMEKVRQKILKDHEKSEIREKNKLKRINKKFNKKCGSLKVKNQKEAIQKKKNLEKIDELKKNNNLESLNVQEFFLKHSKSSNDKSINKNDKNRKVDKKWTKRNFTKKKNEKKFAKKFKKKNNFKKKN